KLCFAFVSNSLQIVRFFNDEDSDHSPFSLHELVRVGEASGKKPGDWYGPNSVAHTISHTVNNTSHPTLETLRVYVAQDCTVYKEDVIKACTHCKNCFNPACQDKFWRSLLILVPVRLGSESLNPIYIPCLKALLALDCCVGIIGGRPKHSLYFVGFQGDKLIHLDPHYLQDKVDMSTRDFPVDSFHCQYPKKMSFEKMDPSCAIGFYCRTRADFENFCQEAKQVSPPPKQRIEYPMFIFDEGSNPSNVDFDFVDNSITQGIATVTLNTASNSGQEKDKKKLKKLLKLKRKSKSKEGVGEEGTEEETVEEYVLVD
ncbi:cysteine protease ATG4D-like, partial [Clytia hemisphaerica]|uniref:cysteine protease ATG4D-like n=1 Tax=Clytia hemisphaerica TaxID=252671 RepID=UPI0034D3F6EC